MKRESVDKNEILHPECLFFFFFCQWSNEPWDLVTKKRWIRRCRWQKRRTGACKLWTVLDSRAAWLSLKSVINKGKSKENRMSKRGTRVDGGIFLSLTSEAWGWQACGSSSSFVQAKSARHLETATCLLATRAIRDCCHAFALPYLDLPSLTLRKPNALSNDFTPHATKTTRCWWTDSLYLCLILFFVPPQEPVYTFSLESTPHGFSLRSLSFPFLSCFASYGRLVTTFSFFFKFFFVLLFLDFRFLRVF